MQSTTAKVRVVMGLGRKTTAENNVEKFRK